jgi:hypothetical protein
MTPPSTGAEDPRDQRWARWEGPGDVARTAR